MSWFKKKHKNEMYKYDEEEEDRVQHQVGGVGGIVIDDVQSHSHSLPTDLPGVTNKQFKTIFWMNIVAFIAQAASATGIFLLMNKDVTFQFYTNYPMDPTQGMFGAPNAQPSFTLNLGWLTGVFLGLSSLDHLLVCTVFKKYYEKGISGHYNIFRWIEYALSASIMRVAVGVLCGITDLHMQFLIFGLTAVTMLFGMVFELENRDLRLSGNVRWYIYWLGFIPHFFSWAVVAGYFFYSLSLGDPPAFVYSIIAIIFTLDISFAVVLGLQWQGKRCFRPYVNGEIAFIILSFTSKNLLAWINFFGGNAEWGN